ncbi:MAG: hypothetical protein ACFCGT_09375 [Sandaracinaceae bacterium]
MEIDYEAAFARYEARCAEALGDAKVGAYAKLGRTLVQRLSEDEFPARLDRYVELHEACREMIESGATISDALVHDFEEAAAWVAVEAPDIYAMFRGEIGTVEEAAPPSRPSAPGRGARRKQGET